MVTIRGRYSPVKIGLPDDGTTAPSGKSDGYASVAYIDTEGRIYFFVNGAAYYLTGTAVAVPVTGNPIGLALVLTYTV